MTGISILCSFNRGTVAGTINGCWIIGSITPQTEQKGVWRITNVPRLDKAAGAVNYSNQGGSSWMVLANSENQEIAVDFLKHTLLGV
ncbi:extracellular solute-binding protein [Iocasia frigidifontis]|uniref:extracellular solute-binding protein n=1 Tax=Iocasia fonsfrigidae TaxID=2682810 RepID=UPI001E423E51|nr:extracellular solute-binding protein [Iocasia fonsfrigidae]